MLQGNAGSPEISEYFEMCLQFFRFLGGFYETENDGNVPNLDCHFGI